jgi:hypothetical protein
VNETLDRVRRFTFLDAPPGAGLAHGGQVGEGRIAAAASGTGVVEQMARLPSPEDQPVGSAIPGLVEVAKMEAIGTTPISSAMKSARRGSARLKTSCRSALEGHGIAHLERAQPLRADAPPGATSIESVIEPLCVGEESMLQARTILGPNGTEIHWPASNVQPQAQ